MNKHEIPAATLDTATEAIASTQYCSQWGAGKLAEIALEAANLPELLAERDLLARQVAKYEEAVREAEAILGGEYGDDFAAFAELVSDARFMRREASK